MGKKKTPRNRQERLEYAKTLKRGKCLELYRPITECTPADLGLADVGMPVGINELRELTVGDLCDKLNIAPGALCYKIVNHSEGMRDIADVKQVMTEGDILGSVIPVRCSPMVSRIVTKTLGFTVEKPEKKEPEPEPPGSVG